jgi:trigger factor
VSPRTDNIVNGTPSSLLKDAWDAVTVRPADSAAAVAPVVAQLRVGIDSLLTEITTSAFWATVTSRDTDPRLLREIMKAQLEQQTAGLTRTQMKRALLDQLAAGHSFEVPATMVEAEFAQIWQQLQQEAARDEYPAEAMKEIEAEKDDYRHIAERRVRLGLLLSEIGQANGVEVSGQEMSMLIQQAAQQYRPEDRQRFVEYIRSEPMAAAQLRAPLYEDKVVDFLFDKADVTEREVTVEELQAAIEAEDGAEAAPAPKKAAAKKKAPAKKADIAEEATASEEEPAKQASAKKAPAKKAAPAAEEKPAAKKALAKKAAAKK